MADSTPRPADFRVDRLSVVRAWLWRHSSQPNGDPWDGDPEHLDWAAQHLLGIALAQLLLAGRRTADVTVQPFVVEDNGRLGRVVDAQRLQVQTCRAQWLDRDLRW